MMQKFQKSRAVFLDRDGVINRETGGYVYKPEEFKLNEGLFDALKLFRDRGFILVVVTNQGGIGQNLYTHKHVEIINEILKNKLSEHGLEIAEIYYCPHHPVSGKCLCRKPESLLLEKAIARFDIDPSLSFMIGDNERDIRAAEKAGVKGVLIKANDSLMKYENIIRF